jgi:tetratricopeptide (TPR) repeat protein
MSRPRTQRLILAAALVAVGAERASGTSAAPVRGFTGAAGVSQAYSLVYDADFAGAEARLKQACPPAPQVACDLVNAGAIWWRIALDPMNKRHDAAFMAQVNLVIGEAEQWTAREPERAEAWFYLGAAYGLRGQYHVQRTEYFSAARYGKRIKNALEKAIALDPGMSDAYFGVGLYQYIADISPTVLKVLRWLMMMPGGDKTKGLQQMIETQQRGLYLGSEADYQLHLIYLWYEHQTDRAMALLRTLEARHPHNPFFPLSIAEVYHVYLQDYAAALATYRAVLQGTRSGALRLAEMAEVQARMGMAAMLDDLYETDRAVAELTTVVAMKPQVPYSALAQAYFALGRANDRLGYRQRAIAAYRAAQATAPPDDPYKLRSRGDDAASDEPDRKTAEAYRLSLEGWRALERGAVAEAAPLLDRALQLRASDPVIVYRRARLDQARDNPAQAIAGFQRVLQSRPLPPDIFVASSYFELGRLLESSDRTRAISMYENAARVRGADAPTRELAGQALARLRQ